MAAVAAAPALINTAFAVHFFTAPARASIPFYSDEVAYWNQVATFREAGFGGGYITVNERAAPLSLSRFGPHGPTFAVIYGSLARLTGWTYSSAVDLNLLLVTASAFVWLAATAPSLTSALTLLATFWPLILALTTTMQEPLQYALVLLMAALIVRMVRVPHSASRASLVFAAIVGAASLLRPSWALVLVPWFADRASSTGRRWIARALGLAVTGALSALFFFVLTAPYPGSVEASSAGVVEDPLAALTVTASRVAANLARLLSPRDSAWLEIIFRYESLALLAALIFTLASPRHHVDDQRRRILTIATWFLGLTVLAVMAAGSIESWRDYRVLTPALFFTLLLTVNAEWGPVRIVFAAHLLLLPVAAITFADLYEPKFRADRTLVAAFAAETASALTFHPGAPGWSNTLLVPTERYEYPLLGVPAGIGVSSFFGWPDVTLPLKSRYVLLRSSERERAPDTVRLRKIRDTVHGTLYENLDSPMLESPK